MICCLSLVSSVTSRGALLAALGCAVLPIRSARAQSAIPGWPGYGGSPQHRAGAPVRTQPLRQIRWSTPVDLDPQLSDGDLLIHYGSPLITPANTVLVPVKTGATDGFRVEAHRGDDGTLLWSHDSDYTLPAHNWVPSFGPTLTPDDKLVYPGRGGTIYIRSSPDSPNGATTQNAFYGLADYIANRSACDASVTICTPITADADGNLFFGFVVSGTPPLGLQSGLARISASGVGTWVSAAAAAADSDIRRVTTNGAPALSEDGRTVYVAVTNLASHGHGTGYLLALDSQTLQLKSTLPASRALLRDAGNPANLAYIHDDSTASPTVGPDGDVYFGVLENPFFTNHMRGWLLHFNADLTVQKTSGAFGWDDTVSLVPAAAVPSYTGLSSYLLLTKYNNYVEGGGDGVNRVAVLDPNDPMTVNGLPVMREILTIAGPTPDEDFLPAYPNAVREWCINSGVVDPFTRSALVNNEDGKLYRWDFATNTLSESVTLTTGIGEAYTPTLSGPDGTVYAINNSTLYAVGLNSVSISGRILLEDGVPFPQLVHFNFRPQDGTAPLTRSAICAPDGSFLLTDIPARRYDVRIKGAKWLAKVVPNVDASGGSVTTLAVTLPGGDANDDNSVDVFDLALLIEAFNTRSGDPLYRDEADLNGDTSADALDLDILIHNFNTEGDP